MSFTVPVVFYDGQQQTSLGDVVVSSYLNFNNFQSMLSYKIGISPHQFSTYLSRGTSSRIPVTAKFNFSAVCGQGECFFVVVLKRSRGRRGRGMGLGWGNVVMLRRGGEKERDMWNEKSESESRACEECMKGESEGGFHWCVRDTVTFGFKSLAGPIAPPLKHKPF